MSDGNGDFKRVGFGSGFDVQAMVEQLRLKSIMVPGLAEATAEDVERERVRIRRERMSSSRAVQPDRGSPEWRAMERIIRARSVRDCAIREHVGSVSACEGAADLLEDVGATFAVLFGGVGSGKTFAGYAAIAERGGVVIWGGDVKPFGEAWNLVRERAMTAGLLVINDLTEKLDGKDSTPAHPGGWAWDQIAEVCEYRADMSRKTLITTNMTMAGLIARLGDRCKSRMDRVIVATCGGKDLRGRK